MSDIFREVDEDVRRERLAEFGKRYGAWIAAALIAVVLGTAGWVTWQRWQQNQQAARTERLAEALELVQSENDKAAIQALSGFSGRDGGPGMLARFYAAGLLADNKDIQGAAAAYDALSTAADVQQAYRELALLLSVLHQVDTGDPKLLIDRLKPLDTPAGPWRHTVRELTAILTSRSGDREGAYKLFNELAEDETAPAALRGRARELASVSAG